MHCRAAQEILKDSESRRKERNKRRHAEDFDEEELEALELENETEEEVVDQVRERTCCRPLNLLS